MVYSSKWSHLGCSVIAALWMALCPPADAQPIDSRAQHIHPAASDLTTDLIIVRYKNGQDPLNRMRAQSAMQVAANRQGVQSTVLRQMAGGTQLLKLSRPLNPEDAQAFANNLRNGNADVESAEPDGRSRPSLMLTFPLKVVDAGFAQH